MKIVTEYGWLLLDLLAIGVLVYCVRQCAKRGLAFTLVSFFSYIAAAVVARLGAPALSRFLYDNFVRDILRVSLGKSIGEVVESSAELASSIIGALPKLLVAIMGAGGRAMLADSPLGDGAEGVVEFVIDNALAQPVGAILNAGCFLLLFTVTMFVLRYIGRMTLLVNRLPLIGGINSLLGGILGLAQGLVLLVVVCVVLRLLFGITGGGWSLLNPGVIEKTYIWRVFYHRLSM